MTGIIIPKEFKSHWCSTWMLTTHHWNLMVAVGKNSWPNVFHQCKMCGYEDEARMDVSNESIMEIKLSD